MMYIISDVFVPDPPTGFSFSLNANGYDIDCSWTNQASTHFDSVVFEAVDENGNWIELVNGTSSSHTVLVAYYACGFATRLKHIKDLQESSYYYNFVHNVTLHRFENPNNRYIGSSYVSGLSNDYMTMSRILDIDEIASMIIRIASYDSTANGLDSVNGIDELFLAETDTAPSVLYKSLDSTSFSTVYEVFTKISINRTIAPNIGTRPISFRAEYLSSGRGAAFEYFAMIDNLYSLSSLWELTTSFAAVSVDITSESRLGATFNLAASDTRIKTKSDLGFLPTSIRVSLKVTSGDGAGNFEVRVGSVDTPETSFDYFETKIQSYTINQEYHLEFDDNTASITSFDRMFIELIPCANSTTNWVVEFLGIIVV
jgi:hypothetical protein